ncbi:unnamed protein product [Lactuca saligna]|uniref:Kinesin motor domain-containing protein n=1 Tax=Lactuca saligna TaxID=75948 RepID=A0AA35YAT1_LACSI|nr:unnamed protein product [Lactuca saligna]
MEMKSPQPCPKTVTVRRNPPRRARPTPATVVPVSAPPSSKTSSAIRSFPIQDILSIDIPEKQEIPEPPSPKESPSSEKLKVFLRIKPIVTQPKVGVSVKNAAHKNVWPQNPNKKKDATKTAKVVGKKTNEICLKVNDLHSVTLCPPQSLADARRTKSEVYEGFSHVFCAESSQSEVYEKMVNPLVEDFLKGKSGMIAAMGPSGSGKTHTVFGTTREPGMVPLALRQIFSEKESNESKCSRTFYLSMFEIYSERGKGEKIMDLSQEGGDLFMQQSNIKGLKETIIHDVQQAESLIAIGMSKRSTAMTNSNIQSSRSQCIINIRSDHENIDFHSYFHTGVQPSTAILTIVDLAGAEREKRTGNQGARLLESNFINNTSMVFGLCLRSLLEHQKNPKKPFHKHFQNSMLTKYLRDFLEGKKRMSLILTAKSGEEDYQDTSYMLRQASPFMNIKFENIEEQPTNAFGNKKRTQTLPKIEQSKRMKFNPNEVFMDNELKGDILHQILKEELTPEKVKEVDEIKDSSVETPCNNINTEVINKNKSHETNTKDSVKTFRENHILLNFSRALWNVLKEYKNKLEASEYEVKSLRHSLSVEKERNYALETELNLIKYGKETITDILVVEENESKATSANCSHVHEGTSSVEDVSTSISDESFQEPSKEKDDIAPYEYVVFDKEDLKELKDKDFSTEIGCDNLESTVHNSELLVTQEHEKEEGITSVEVTSAASCPETFDNLLPAGAESDSELTCVHEDEVLSSPLEQLKQEQNEGINAVEVISVSIVPETSEDQCNEKIDVSNTNIVLDEQEFKEVEEREANGEIAGCDTSVPAGAESAFSCVLEDEVSSSPLKENHPKQEQKEKSDVSDTNLSFDKQELKENEEKETNGELTDEVSSSPLKEDQSKQEEKEKQKEEEKQSLIWDNVCCEDVNESKLQEPSNIQPCKSSSAVKPKRRLRPVSSVMLRNINILDSVDATEITKHGKRGGEKDVEKRTQGSISLMRLLKQNLHH